jgi:hypothetical protein
MSIPDRHQEDHGPYPFGFTDDDYRQLLEQVRDRDLLADLEHLQGVENDLAAIAEEQQRFVLEYAHDDSPGGNLAVAEILLANTLRKLEASRFEIDRRLGLYLRTAGHPLARRFPPADDSLGERIRAVKAAWPIDRFVEIVLGADLTPTKPGQWTCRCPLPGHEDRTPSFIVFGQGNAAKCFGCQRGGDVLDLTGYAFGLDRLYDQIAQLERLAGTGTRGRS